MLESSLLSYRLESADEKGELITSMVRRPEGVLIPNTSKKPDVAWKPLTTFSEIKIWFAETEDKTYSSIIAILKVDNRDR